MKILFSTLALLSLLVFSQTLFADGPAAPKTLAELKVAIEKIRTETNTPAVGIALVNKDGPYWVAGLGDANVKQHIKADADTMFPIASVSKMFVGLAILKLMEDGKLNLNDKLRDLAPEIQFENQWEKTNPILLVHLLEHTTGWDDLHLAEITYKATDASTLKDALAAHPDSRKSRWVPGTRHAYGNTSPAVVAYIVEKVTGKKFEDYVQESFFNPLQMNTSSFYNSAAYKAHKAELYSPDYAYQKYRPSGAMNSSAKEMANFLQFMILRGEFNGQRLLQSASIDRMEKPVSNLGATVGIESGYALYNVARGFKDYGIAFYGHDGGGPGALTAFVYIPELQTGYVVMTNAMGSGHWQITELINQFLLKDAKKVTPKALDLSPKFSEMAGIYVHLNPRVEILRFTTDILSAIKITVQDQHIHRSPLLGGWESSDYAISENLLVNPWTGLPSIAFVNDPVKGESLQIDSDLYKRTPAFIVYGKIMLIALLAILILFNIGFALVWIPRWLLRKLTNGGNILVRLWPLIASLTIVITFVPTVLAAHVQLGTLTSASLTLFIGSILYPLITGFSLLSVYKYRTMSINKLVYWNAAAISILHALFALYLAYYGIIGFRGWVE
jgi:CubicO group peptidase (beta-lactamase class C family)